MVDLIKEKIASLRWAIVLSGFLTLFKGVVSLYASSAALLASALDSLMDVGLSSVNYLSVKKAAAAADQDHAYGHEKIESLASYTQGILILVFAFLMIGESIRRSIKGNFLSHATLAFLTVVIASLVNLVLTGILHHSERKTGSLILKTEKTHYLMDILSYLVILLALLLVRWTHWPGWDIVGGIGVAGYVAFLARQILTQAAGELVDRSLPKVRLSELDDLIRRHDPRILSYHELRTHKAGSKTFIDFHLVLKPQQSFVEAHEITESLIEKIKARFSNADVTVHEDPEGGR